MYDILLVMNHNNTIHTVLDPGPVRNLSADVDKSVPSVTLSWKPPVNVQSAEELTGYWIRFNPYGSENYTDMTVSGAATSVVLTRESSQLIALKLYHFQVNAQSGCGGGEWRDVSAYYGIILRTCDVIPFKEESFFLFFSSVQRCNYQPYM